MASVFVAAVIVAFTWLATVRWARFGDEPRGTRCAPAEAPRSPSCGSRDAGTPPEPAESRTRRPPTWSQT